MKPESEKHSKSNGILSILGQIIFNLPNVILLPPIIIAELTLNIVFFTLSKFISNISVEVPKNDTSEKTENLSNILKFLPFIFEKSHWVRGPVDFLTDNPDLVKKIHQFLFESKTSTFLKQCKEFISKPSFFMVLSFFRAFISLILSMLLDFCIIFIVIPTIVLSGLSIYLITRVNHIWSSALNTPFAFYSSWNMQTFHDKDEKKNTGTHLDLKSSVQIDIDNEESALCSENSSNKDDETIKLTTINNNSSSFGYVEGYLGNSLFVKAGALINDDDKNGKFAIGIQSQNSEMLLTVEAFEEENSNKGSLKIQVKSPENYSFFDATWTTKHNLQNNTILNSEEPFNSKLLQFLNT